MPKSTMDTMNEAAFREDAEGVYSPAPDGARSRLKKTMGSYANCTFENYVVEGDTRRKAAFDSRVAEENARRKAAFDACKEYAETWRERYAEGNGLVLYGTVGTGKDHLSAAIVAHVMRTEKDCWGEWVWCREAFESLRADLERESEYLNRLRRAPILVVSDPLPVSGGMTPWQADVLNRLADHRCAQMLPTIVTLNVSGDRDGQAQVGAATWDRLTHRAWVIETKWPSRRAPARRINCGD